MARHEPTPPLLGLCLYLPGTDRENLRRLVEVRRGGGARVDGPVAVYRHGPGERVYFASETDLEPVASVQVREVGTWEQLAVEPSLTLLSVPLSIDGHREIATYVAHFAPGIHSDAHPVVIWRESTDVTESARAGQDVYAQFKLLVDALEPTYAAITFEIPMECPTDLIGDPSSPAFRTCYVSTWLADKRRLRDLVRSFDRIGAYTEDWSSGTYISCDATLGPAGPFHVSEDKAWEISSQVGGFLAGRFAQIQAGRLRLD